MNRPVRVPVMVAKHVVLWAVGFAVVLGLFGGLAEILDREPGLFLDSMGLGAYLGAFFGIGQGLKASLQGPPPRPVREPTAKALGTQLGRDVGEHFAGGLIPGVGIFLLIKSIKDWFGGARFSWGRPGQARRALLESISWTLLAVGGLLLVYGILRLDTGQVGLWQALLLLPATALFGWVTGAFGQTES